MTKFIRVTEAMTRGDLKPLLLNADHIMHVQGGLNGENTHIRMTELNKHGGNTYYFVKESAESIWEQLMTDYTKPPMVISAEEYAAYKKRNSTNGMG